MAAWDRLSAGSARFRRRERLFSLVWGVALLSECAARLVGAFTLPISTMVWLSTVLVVGAIAVAMVVGSVVSAPMAGLIDAELDRA